MTGVERTLDRAKFLALMAEWGHASSAELVEAVLEDMGWGERQAFTKADVVAVMEGVTAAAQGLLADAPGATAEQKAHLSGLIGAVQAHAIPLLKQDAAEQQGGA